MPKAKLEFPFIDKVMDKKKLEVAAAFSNVQLGEAMDVGDVILVECSSGDPQNFLKMDRLRQKVKGTELDKKK